MNNNALELSIANHFGVDIDGNMQNLLAIKEALLGLEDIREFKEFAITNKNFYEYMKYFKATEKILELRRMFDLERAKKMVNYELAESFSKELAKKVEAVRRFMTKELEAKRIVKFSNLVTPKTKEKIFTKKELKALYEVAKSCCRRKNAYTHAILNYSYENELEDKIEELFIEQTINELVKRTKTTQISI